MTKRIRVTKAVNLKDKSQLKQILDFLHEAEKLKTLLRHSWLSSGRQESVAEHSWRVALLALVLAPKVEDQVNLEKVLKMVIVHDLGEIHSGDHHAWKGKLKNKHTIERKGLLRILNQLSLSKG